MNLYLLAFHIAPYTMTKNFHSVQRKRRNLLLEISETLKEEVGAK